MALTLLKVARVETGTLLRKNKFKLKLAHSAQHGLKLSMVTRSEKGEEELYLASAKLAVLEENSHKRCFMDGAIIRGRRPESMVAAYQEL